MSVTRLSSFLLAVTAMTLAPLALGCAGSHQPQAYDTQGLDPLSNLSWLVGSWARLDGERTTTEVWTSPIGGTMYGYGRVHSVDATEHFELLRVDTRAGQLVYVASPVGQATTSFVASEVREGQVTFTNSTHDYPNVIRYMRTDGTLTARISDNAGGRASEWHLTTSGAQPTFTPAEVELCVQDDGSAVSIAVAPCWCASTVRCAAYETEDSVDLAIVIEDNSCDACSEAVGTCELSQSARGKAMSIHGSQVFPPGEALPNRCSSRRAPLLVAE